MRAIYLDSLVLGLPKPEHRGFSGSSIHRTIILAVEGGSLRYDIFRRDGPWFSCWIRILLGRTSSLAIVGVYGPNTGKPG